MKISETQQKILNVGKREFLEKGFKDASLRRIVSEAGFTKGAFYGYYPNKAALFEALVSEAADGLREQFKAAQDAHFDLIPENKAAESRELSGPPIFSSSRRRKIMKKIPSVAVLSFKGMII